MSKCFSLLYESLNEKSLRRYESQARAERLNRCGLMLRERLAFPAGDPTQKDIDKVNRTVSEFLDFMNHRHRLGKDPFRD